MIDLGADGLSCRDGAGEIHAFLSARGFTSADGGMYLGDETVDAIHCVLVVQGLAEHLPWFAASVRDIRMLRIDEISDLRRVLDGTDGHG